MSKKPDPSPDAPDDNDDQPVMAPTDDQQPDRVADLTADLQRVQADFVNFRRRAESEKSEVMGLAKNRVVREFLAVRDSFDHELAHRPATVDAAWAASIDSIRTQFDQVLKAMGAERFESKGHPFDPHLHEAVAMEDGPGDREVVTEELQPGYKVGDQILRHAVVKVGKQPDPDASTE